MNNDWLHVRIQKAKTQNKSFVKVNAIYKRLKKKEERNILCNKLSLKTIFYKLILIVIQSDPDV